MREQQRLVTSCSSSETRARAASSCEPCDEGNLASLTESTIRILEMIFVKADQDADSSFDIAQAYCRADNKSYNEVKETTATYGSNL